MNFSKNTKKLLQVILLLVGLIILVFIIRQSGIVENYQLLFTVSIPLLVIAFALSTANIIVKIYRWKYLSEKYNQPITLKEASVVTVSSLYFANITPGKVGDLFKAYFMQKKYKMDFFDGVSMIFYERFFELMILFLTATAIIFIELRGVSVIILELSAALLLLLALFYYKADYFMKHLERFVIRLPVIKTNEVNFHIKKLPFMNIFAVFIITFISLVLEFARLWVVALAFGFFLNPLQVSIVFSLAIVAGLISQIPLGIGIMEGSLSYLLQEMGVNPLGSITIVLTDRIISMYYALILGFVFSKVSLDALNNEVSQ
ncbi:MAG: lysylphosphatidylglycerol synthase transmembrane domain-containing protein [Methanoregula sp.]